MICKIELEYPPQLRKWFLENLLINPSGKPGHVQEGDLKLEHVNKPLEKSINHKNERWDGRYLREVVSPNILDLEDMKKGVIDALELRQKSATHTFPGTKAEFKRLTEIYRSEQLHKFRAGRDYGREGKDVACYERGVVALGEGEIGHIS